MSEIKYVTYRHLKKGQKVTGGKNGNVIRSFTGYVKESNAAYVILELWYQGGLEERYSSDWEFGIELTYDEFRKKYNKMAGEIVKAFQNHLGFYEIGYHEMWNSWLSSSPWELAKACKEHNLKIIGYCKDIEPRYSWISNDLLDVGICVENMEGDRFWCHFQSEEIELMTKRYEKYQSYVNYPSPKGNGLVKVHS